MRTLTTALFFVCLILSACVFNNETIDGNGNVASETRKAGNTSKIKITGGMDVILQEGPSAVKVEAEGNLLPYILTNDDGNWLEIRTKNHINLNTNSPIKVYVTTPLINGISIAGSGNVTSDSKFKSGEPLTIKIAGGGDVTLDVNTPEVDANIAGSGNINLSGETKDVEVSVAGSGNFHGRDLKAENAKVKITGSGDVTVYADVNLNAKITGSGSIKYLGNATVDQKVVGSGEIRKIQ